MDFLEEDDDIRSSRSQMFFKIDVLKNLTIFTGKRLCWSLFLIDRCNPEIIENTKEL